MFTGQWVMKNVKSMGMRGSFFSQMFGGDMKLSKKRRTNISMDPALLRLGCEWHWFRGKNRPSNVLCLKEVRPWNLVLGNFFPKPWAERDDPLRTPATCEVPGPTECILKMVSMVKAAWLCESQLRSSYQEFFLYSKLSCVATFQPSILPLNQRKRLEWA